MTQYAQLTLDGMDAPSAKIIALRKVEAHADPAWLDIATFGVKQLAVTQDVFTTDEVWEWLDRNTPLRPHEPRAMGAVMKKVAAEGVIEASGLYQQSAREECHNRPVMIWRSRLRPDSTAVVVR